MESPPSPPRSLQHGGLVSCFCDQRWCRAQIPQGEAAEFLGDHLGGLHHHHLGRAKFCLKLRTYFDLWSLIHCFKGLNPVRAFWGAHSLTMHQHLRVTYRREHGVIAVNWHPNFVMGKLFIDSTLLEIATFWEPLGRSRYTSMHHHQAETAPLPVFFATKHSKSRDTFPWLVLWTTHVKVHKDQYESHANAPCRGKNLCDVHRVHGKWVYFPFPRHLFLFATGRIC